MTVARFERIVAAHGGRPATAEESRLFAEAMRRTDAKIARRHKRAA